MMLFQFSFPCTKCCPVNGRTDNGIGTLMDTGLKTTGCLFNLFSMAYEMFLFFRNQTWDGPLWLFSHISPDINSQVICIYSYQYNNKYTQDD